MVFPHKYKITVFDEVNNKEKIETGIVFATTYSEAVRRLEEYYGEENLSELNYLSGFDVGNGYVLSCADLEDLGYIKIG